LNEIQSPLLMLPTALPPCAAADVTMLTPCWLPKCSA
jgi:hypothetical protein